MDTQVGRGRFGIIDGDSTIYSNGHDLLANANNLIVVNLEKHTALMCHIADDGLTNLQRESIRRFASELGAKHGFITIPETMAKPRREVERILEDNGINYSAEHAISKSVWNVAFNLGTQQVTITDMYGKLLHEHTPFPPFVDIPEEEAGLSDRDRVIRRLSAFTDSATGELDQKALSELQKIFTEKSELISPLLGAFQAQRANAAGFEYYGDYIEADSRNSTNMAPDSPELVLRKIIGGPSIQRLERSGIDFSQVKITPQAVAEIFNEYPEVLMQFLRATESAHKRGLG